MKCRTKFTISKAEIFGCLFIAVFLSRRCLLPTKKRSGGKCREGTHSRAEPNTQLVGSTDSAIARLRDSVIRKVSMVIPSRPWQGAPAARAPLHPHRQTGLSTLHPFAQMPALLAVATVQEIIEAGATYGRCITSQAERSSSPDTPMMKRAFALPSTPSPNPLWIGCVPSYSPDGSRAGACLPLATQPFPRGQPSAGWMHGLSRFRLPLGKLVCKRWNYALAEAQPPWHNSANKTQV